MTDYDAPSGLGGGALLRLYVVQTSQNAGLNQSTDAWALILYKGTYSSYDFFGIPYSVSINGTVTAGTFTFDFTTTTSVIIATGSQTVTHNTDGTKSISVSGYIGNTGTSTGGPATAAGSFTQTPLTTPVAAAVVSRLSHTRTQPFEHLALAATSTDLFSAIKETTVEAGLTLPDDLSDRPVAFGAAGSALDAFNEILTTEQGAIYSTTTGSLTAPEQTLVVRGRNRPVTVAAIWDFEDDLDGSPEFVRDITNMASTVTATGIGAEATYTDSTVSARSGSTNISESILNTQSLDVLAWAEDRLQRGANVQLRLASVTIDAMTTSADRTTELLALVPGDRHRFTGLPSTQLGFSTWDGWLLGVDESHTLTEHTFTLYFQPVLPATAVYNVSRYMAGGALTLSAALNNSATSMSVTTSVATTLLETSSFPYTLVIDSEYVTVTACTSAAPQVATITRGIGGTTAASHSSGATVELSEYSPAQIFPATTLYPTTSLYPVADPARSYYAF